MTTLTLTLTDDAIRRAQLGPYDWSHLAQTYEASIDECDREGWEYEGEVVMTSIGYVDLYRDGDVGAFGVILGNCLDEDC